MGVRNLLILSNGVAIQQHPSLPRLRHNLKEWKEKLAGQEPGSRRWHETLRIIAKTEEQIYRCQQDYAAKIAATLCRHYRVICIEATTIGPIIEKNEEYFDAVRDARWDLVTEAIRKKARETNRTFVEVAPFFTTQTCSRCQQRTKMPLGARTYDCPHCGLSIDRDTNAAINIRKKGIDKLNRQQKSLEKQRNAPF